MNNLLFLVVSFMYEVVITFLDKILVYFTEEGPEIIWGATVEVKMIYFADKKFWVSFLFTFIALDSIPLTPVWKKVIKIVF